MKRLSIIAGNSLLIPDDTLLVALKTINMSVKAIPTHEMMAISVLILIMALLLSILKIQP